MWSTTAVVASAVASVEAVVGRGVLFFFVIAAGVLSLPCWLTRAARNVGCCISAERPSLSWLYREGDRDRDRQSDKQGMQHNRGDVWEGTTKRSEEQRSFYTINNGGLNGRYRQGKGIDHHRRC